MSFVGLFPETLPVLLDPDARQVRDRMHTSTTDAL
jgi:hypothetical protein